MKVCEYLVGYLGYAYAGLSTEQSWHVRGCVCMVWLGCVHM
jgi:hypothetical protein